ncbi:unnamed protein product [Soboliphyme baturini]|uniref:Apple domain-containing protein n=1 Tax=Soboliphyme baturini TaxID=241478 RepID=A0A183J322_9BILA|nr:unnamed protein product [Soboliphyme baturini]
MVASDSTLSDCIQRCLKTTDFPYCHHFRTRNKPAFSTQKQATRSHSFSFRKVTEAIYTSKLTVEELTGSFLHIPEASKCSHVSALLDDPMMGEWATWSTCSSDTQLQHRYKSCGNSDIRKCAAESKSCRSTYIRNNF